MPRRLFPRSDNAPFLHPQEVARRITDHFPNAIVDWTAANQRLQSELEKLQLSGAPAPIIEGHLNLFGNTADITVNSPLNPENRVHLMVYLDSAVELSSKGDILTHAALAEIRGLSCRSQNAWTMTLK